MSKRQIHAVITDLDGTLLNSNRLVSPKNRAALEKLAHKNILRVACTGRSPELALRVLPQDFPIDYVIYSTGVGSIQWPTQKLLFEHHFAQETAQTIHAHLLTTGLNFMAHFDIATSHTFFAFTSAVTNSDYMERLQRLQKLIPEKKEVLFDRASQFVIVTEGTQHQLKIELEDKIQDVSVVIATSPLDSQYIWIEILPREVSKAKSAQKLLDVLGISDARVAAIGNDYNDLDLLHWAEIAYVVENAPNEIREQFPYVASHDKDGFAEFCELICG